MKSCPSAHTYLSPPYAVLCHPQATHWVDGLNALTQPVALVTVWHLHVLQHKQGKCASQRYLCARYPSLCQSSFPPTK